MRTFLGITLLVLLYNSGFSIDQGDTVIRKFYPNNKLQAIESFRKTDKGLIQHGLFVEYYQNGQIKDSCSIKMGIHVGKRKMYSKKGVVEAEIDYGGDSFPRKVVAITHLKSGACRLIKQEVSEDSPGSFGNDEILKYYWKSGHIMDSVISKNNIKIFRARFYDGGNVFFTAKYPDNAKDGDEVIVQVFNIDGTLRSSRIEIKGKNGY